MWIARDKRGSLYLFNNKPTRGIDIFEPNDGCCMEIDCDLFPEIRWEDEPQEVCICINNEKYHTVKLEELNRLYEIDWKYQDMKETLESYQDMIDNYRKLPWYKRIFNNI